MFLSTGLQTAPLKRRTQILLLIGCGLRREELLGLQYKDLRKDCTTLNIERAIIKRFPHEEVDDLTGSSVRTAPLKTKNAKRTVDIPNSVTTILREYRSQFGHILPWIFPEHPDSLYTWLKRFCTRNKFRHISPHTLRHMHITYKHYAGIPLAEISKDAGHSNKAFTMRQYVGIVENRTRAGADTLEAKINIK